MQPRLTAESSPITLHVMFRPLKFVEGDESKVDDFDKNLADAMMKGFLANFIDEGFDKSDVEEAKNEVSQRFSSSSKVVLLPASKTPNGLVLARSDAMLAKQMLDAFKVPSLDQITI